jgi:type I restriction enzyme, S subunit
VIPAGWKCRNLGELLDVQNGFAFDSALFSESKGMPLIRIRDLKNGVDTVVRYKGEFDEKFVIRKNDLLIGMDGEFRCYEWRSEEALLNQRVCKLINFSDEIEPEFIEFGIDVYLKQIEDATPYVTVKHLSAKSIKSIEFPFPDRTEQRQIVTRIKECMERVEEIEGLRASSLSESSCLIESLIEAELADVQGEEVTMADVCEITSRLIDPRDEQYQSMLHVGGANIESKTGCLIDLKTAAEEKLKSGKFVFDETMVLYNKIRPYLMKTARPDFPGLCSADMYPLTPKSEYVTRDFLYYLLMSRRFTDYAIAGSNRAGMPKVNRKHLFGYKFKLPKIEVQQRICEHLDTAIESVQLLGQEMGDAEKETAQLREAILRKAFSGEL